MQKNIIQLRRELPRSISPGVKEQLHYYLSGAGDKWDLSSLRKSICQTTKVTIPGKEQGWAVQ